MYADNSANDMFSASNGATLKNIEWNSTINGYTLIQKERICAGATTSTITLDSSASAEDDYYNNLFIGIVVGDGYGEIFKIIDYDGAKDVKGHVMMLLDKVESKLKPEEKDMFATYQESVMRDVKAGGPRLGQYEEFTAEDMVEDYKNYIADKMGIDEAFVHKMKYRAGIIK